ncbi:hypothetical protein ABIB54_003305 [Frigoribacterium sp. UYMn621]|jgi:hypothetical protein
MRAIGGLFIGVGCVLALIAVIWGRSGYYLSEAPILLGLAVSSLICLGVGAGALRYQKAGFDSNTDARATLADRAFAIPSKTVVSQGAPPLVATPAGSPPAASVAPELTAAVEATEGWETVDEVTRDRPPRTSDWVLVLPDATVLPIADALIIGRQPVSHDLGPTAAVPSAEVSKSHARFSIVAGQLRVRDLETTNGTVIVHPDNTEERASSFDETPLHSGDRLEIGSYSLGVERRP